MQFATILREEAKPAGKVKQTYVLNLKKALVNVRNVFPSHLHAPALSYSAYFAKFEFGVMLTTPRFCAVADRLP